MTYKTTLISLSLLIAALLATGTTFLTLGSSTAATRQAVEPPDAYMEDVIALILDKQGKPKMKIVTPRLVHFRAQDATRLDAPELTIYRKSPQPWYVTSHHARAINGIEAVQFWDDVTIHHSGDQRSPSTLISTQTLVVHPEAQTADSDDPVTFTQPGIVINGIGMHANMNTGDIQVLSQARGEYVPNS